MEEPRLDQCRSCGRKSIPRVVDRVGLRLASGQRADLWRVITETLVRPDLARWTAFDRTSESGLAIDQSRIQRLLRLVSLGRGYRGQIATERVVATRDHVKPRHRCAERLHSKCRAGRCAGRNTTSDVAGGSAAAAAASAAGVRAVNERVEAVDGSQKAATGNQSPFHQFAAGDFTLRKCLYDLRLIFPSVPASRSLAFELFSDRKKPSSL